MADHKIETACTCEETFGYHGFRGLRTSPDCMVHGVAERRCKCIDNPERPKLSCNVRAHQEVAAAIAEEDGDG